MRAIDAATELGVPASVLYAMVDEGVVQGHQRKDRLWVDLGEAKIAVAERADRPSIPS